MANSYHPPGESSAPLPGYGYRDRNDVGETKGTVMIREKGERQKYKMDKGTEQRSKGTVSY